MNCGTGEKENLTVLPHLLPCYISAAKMISGKLGTPRKKHLRLYVVLLSQSANSGIYSTVYFLLSIMTFLLTNEPQIPAYPWLCSLLVIVGNYSVNSAHILSENLRYLYAAVGAKVIFKERNKHSGGATTVLLSVCAK